MPVHNNVEIYHSGLPYSQHNMHTHLDKASLTWIRCWLHDHVWKDLLPCLLIMLLYFEGWSLLEWSLPTIYKSAVMWDTVAGTPRSMLTPRCPPPLPIYLITHTEPSTFKSSWGFIGSMQQRTSFTVSIALLVTVVGCTAKNQGRHLFSMAYDESEETVCNNSAWSSCWHILGCSFYILVQSDTESCIQVTFRSLGGHKVHLSPVQQFWRIPFSTFKNSKSQHGSPCWDRQSKKQTIPILGIWFTGCTDEQVYWTWCLLLFTQAHQSPWQENFHHVLFGSNWLAACRALPKALLECASHAV